MLSLKLVLLLLAMAVAAIATARLYRSRRCINSELPNASRSEEKFTVPHKQTLSTIKPAAETNSIATATSNIVIDADRPIDSDLVAELELADQQIREAEQQVHYSSQADNMADQTSLSAESDSKLFAAASLPNSYADKADISDAVVVDAVDSNSDTLTTGHLNTGSPDSVHKPDAPEPATMAADLRALLIESNTAQLMALENVTEVIKGSEQLARSLHRANQQAHDNSCSHESLHADRLGKLKLAQDNAAKVEQQLRAERKVRQAMEKVISGKKAELKSTKAQIKALSRHLEQNRFELEQERKQLAKARMMARSAAKLARHAAVNQQQARSLAEQEKLLRHKVESRTQQAISIAKNAITALAEEEKKSKINSLLN